MTNRPVDDSRISDAKAARVLDRAAQLDAARGREVSVQELREAAIEAGISADAFERALTELRSMKLGVPDAERSAPLPAPVRDVSTKPGSRSLVFRAALLGGGVALGGFTLLLWMGFGLGDAGIAFSLFIATLVAVGLMLRRRREGAVLDFEIDVVMFWLGLTLILMVADPSSAEDVLANMAGLGSLWALGGGSVVAMSSAKRPKELPEET